MWPWGRPKRDPLPKERLETVEDELRRLRHHLEDLEDVLGRRVDKLMHRARREQLEAEQEHEQPAPDGTGPRVDRRALGHMLLRRQRGLLR